MDTFYSVVPYAAILVGLIIVVLISKALLGIISIAEDEVGQIIKKFSFNGARLPNGRVVATNGEPGYQARVLAPGIHLGYWPFMYHVIKDKVVVIKPGKLGMVSAKDGLPQAQDRVLGKAVSCNMYQDAEAFLSNGGQKGKQGIVLPAGFYRINKALFEVFETDVVMIASDKVGILTAKDGNPMPEGQMAAPVIAGHAMFQDPDKFYANGGCRGLQEQTLLAGQYNLNPWFVTLEEVDLVYVPIGHVGVVVSFVGDAKPDVSGDLFTHGNIVAKGGKGVWEEPLYPGKHPINTRTMKVELVPTTNIVLNWATARSEAHQLDKNLNTITVRSKDGFKFNLDVSQIINIGAKEASRVISRVGSVSNLVAQVLEPIIGNYFRNSAQEYSVLEFLSDRTARQKEAANSVSSAIKSYNVESVDTLIGDIAPPDELMKPLTDRKVAEEQQKTYTTQKNAQEKRQELVAAQAMAEKQTELVNEEQNIEIAKRKALAVVEKADGDAKATEKTGQAQANVIGFRGKNEADAIRAIGLAKAEAARKGVEAMGESYAMVQIVQALAEHNIKLVPDVNVSGAGGNSSDALLGLVLQGLTRHHSGPANPPPVNASETLHGETWLKEQQRKGL